MIELEGVKYYEPQEVAQILGRSEPMIRWLKRNGRLKYINFKSTSLCSEEHLRTADLQRRTRGPKKKTLQTA